MNYWEVLLYATMIGLALMAFFATVRRGHQHSRIGVAGCVLLSAVVALAWTPAEDFQLENYVPRQVELEGYVSSKSCRSCHPDQYDSWHKTYHRTMTQVASPKSVVAPFDPVTLQVHGREFSVERRSDEFWVTMPDADWEVARLAQGNELKPGDGAPIVERRVLMTTGSHHVQAYWVASSAGNEMRLFPWEYFIAEKRWVPVEDLFIRSPDSGRQFSHWNKSCMHCHAVATKPKMDFSTGQMNSEVAEFGISCEACHGPGENHVSFHRNPLNRYQHHFELAAKSTVVNPADCSQKISTQICGQCHSAFVPKNMDAYHKHGVNYRAGDPLENTHHIVRMDDKNFYRPEETGEIVYWNDGTSLVGGGEYNALIESGCFLRGKITCLSCHSMHHSDPNDQLAARMRTNHACLQCHKEYGDRIDEHTHHPADSSGSLCYNCHMPYTSYALMTSIRSHRIDSPNPATSANLGRPNACNLCHLDKTLKWTSDQLTKWYGRSPVELSDEEQQTSAAALWLLKGNAIQRTISAWHFGWEPAQSASATDWYVPFLAEMLEDPYSAVRFIANRSLHTLPKFKDVEFDYVGPEKERSAAKQKMLDVWHRNRSSTGKSPGSELLFKPNGQVNQSRFHALLKQRDDTPVTVPE